MRVVCHIQLSMSKHAQARAKSAEAKPVPEPDVSPQSEGIPSRLAMPSVFPLPKDQATAQALAVAAIHKAHAAGTKCKMTPTVAFSAAELAAVGQLPDCCSCPLLMQYDRAHSSQQLS